MKTREELLAVQLLPPDHGFDQPLGLLSDCHRRIERFLQLLEVVAREAPEHWLPTQYDDALCSSLNYFKDAAPKHTLDEEISLFPRISHDPEASKIIECLEKDHMLSEQSHSEIEELGRRWLSQGYLTINQRRRFAKRVRELITLYRDHIRIEDEELFPMAASILDENDIKVIGQEMATRRHLQGRNEI